MRVMMVTPAAQIKGPIPKHTPHLVSVLRSLGCTVVVHPWGRRTDAEPLSTKLLQRPADVLSVCRELLLARFDLMIVKTAHERSTLIRDIPLVLLARPFVPRIVLQFHGSDPAPLLQPGHTFYKAATRSLLRLADGVLILSKEEKEQWSCFFPKGTFSIVKNPRVLSTVMTDESSVMGRPAGGDSQPVLIFVGRVIEQKGIFELIEAARLLARKHSFRLLIVGDGAAASECRGRVRELGLTEVVTCTGYLEGQQLVQAYRDADIFVLPSWWPEGFPTVLTEAMDAGLPIVTTDIRGAPDHLAEGVNALFVPPKDIGALATALERLLQDPLLRERMSRANRVKVQEFDPVTVAEHYLKELEAIVSADAQKGVVD
jgi:glycosyltransferase involved in cell wall biosynthesis